MPQGSGAIGLAPGLYCGLDTCYDVLEIDRELFNKTDLARIYRRLARKFHPDRARGEDRDEAEARFRLVATAYETLKDDETRQYYDYYLDHPEERYYNYYQYYRLRAVPKVDVRLVILVTILLISCVQYLSASQKYSEALRYAKEQVKYRTMATDIAIQRGLIDRDKQGKVKKRQKNGVETEAIVSAIIEENICIGGGYRKPSIYDTLAWHLVRLPLTLGRWAIWRAQWAKRYWLEKRDYDDEAKLYLIRRHMKVSDDQFQALEPREVEEYMKRELWKKPEFDRWKEEKELAEKEKLASSGRFKQYRRQMKKQAGSTISFLDEM